MKLKFEIGNHLNIDPGLRAFSLESFLPSLLKKVNAHGLSAGRYIGEITDINQRITHGGFTLRNVRNYAAFHGIFSMLLENRLDPPGDYPTPRNIKVRTSKQVLSIITFMEQVQSFHQQILERVKKAKAYRKHTQRRESLTLKSNYETHPSQPKITIPLRRRDTSELVNRVFDYHGQIVSKKQIKLPNAYAVVGQHKFIAELLTLHNIKFRNDIFRKKRRGYPPTY